MVVHRVSAAAGERGGKSSYESATGAVSERFGCVSIRLGGDICVLGYGPLKLRCRGGKPRLLAVNELSLGNTGRTSAGRSRDCYAWKEVHREQMSGPHGGTHTLLGGR